MCAHLQSCTHPARLVFNSHKYQHTYSISPFGSNWIHTYDWINDRKWCQRSPLNHLKYFASIFHFKCILSSRLCCACALVCGSVQSCAQHNIRSIWNNLVLTSGWMCAIRPDMANVETVVQRPKLAINEWFSHNAYTRLNRRQRKWFLHSVPVCGRRSKLNYSHAFHLWQSAQTIRLNRHTLNGTKFQEFPSIWLILNK